MNIRTLILLLSSIYLIIEMQAITFLSEIYTSTPTAEALSQYEKFGYASTGLGLTLFFIKWIFRQKRSKKQVICATFAAPLIYCISIWSVYELVHQAPSWVPTQSRSKAMQASLQTMAVPQWSNLWVFYSEQPESRHQLLLNIKSTIENHPTPDRAVQAAYIQSFRALTVFDEHYQKSSEMLDDSLWPLLWRGANRIAHEESPSTASTIAVEQRIRVLKNWVARNAQMPHRWLNNELAFWSLARREKTLQSILFPDRTEGGSRVLTAIHYIEQSREEKAWEALGQDISGWPAYTISDEDTQTQFRRALSQSTLSPYAHLPLVEIPQYAPGQDHRKQRVYMLAAQQIAPFLFDHKGTPLMTLRSIYDLETRAKFINTLKTGLPPILRENWTRYQTEALLNLSVSTDAWEETTTPKLHEGMLRAGVITPVLFVLSGIMLIINLVSIARANLIVAAATFPLLPMIWFQLWEDGSASLLKTILMISVRESQIFLS